MNSNNGLPLSSQSGLYPYTRLIYKWADKDTKIQLKMTSRELWRHHVHQKFRKNYTEEQSGFMTQLYCYREACPNRIQFEQCFKPPLRTTNSGEVCSPNSPRSRDGWPIVSDPRSWGPTIPPRQVKEWSGCPECWKEFIKIRPEYDLAHQDLHQQILALEKRLSDLNKYQDGSTKLKIGIQRLIQSIQAEIDSLTKNNEFVEMNDVNTNRTFFHRTKNDQSTEFIANIRSGYRRENDRTESFSPPNSSDSEESDSISESDSDSESYSDSYSDSNSDSFTESYSSSD